MSPSSRFADLRLCGFGSTAQCVVLAAAAHHGHMKCAIATAEGFVVIAIGIQNQNVLRTGRTTGIPISDDPMLRAAADPMDDHRMACIDLIFNAGKKGLVICEECFFHHSTGRAPAVKILSPVIGVEVFDGIAFRKDSDMTEKVNALMDELKSDGTLDKLAEKYSLTLAF